MELIKKRAGLMNRMILLAGMALLLCSATAAAAEEYRIGPEDMLQIKFWQDPVLNTTVRVTQDGKVSLDIVGEIEAAGKTIQDLQTEIVRRMSRLNNRISQCVVQVTEYNYQHVFVYGQVNSPGKAGAVENLPKLNRRDAIDVPSSPAGVAPPDIGRMATRKNIVYVMGAVHTPGPIRYQDNLDVMEALAMAGGHTDMADLKHTKLISKDGYYGQTMLVDLEKYALTGTPARHIMRKEDVCVVPFRKQNFMTRNLGTFVTILGAATSALLLYENLKPADEE
jgi:protein involved in polysaccharide export with SLBB domain